MRYLLILVLGASLLSCSNGEVETLKAENEALKNSAQECQRAAEQQAMYAKEAEARAKAVLIEAQKERMQSMKALEDCKKK